MKAVPDWRAIAENLENEHGIAAILPGTPPSVGGGDMNAAWHVETNYGTVYMKTSPVELIDTFNAEAEGLLDLGTANAVRVPNVRAHDVTKSDAYIALEWLEFAPAGIKQEALLGQQLATQHRVTNERYGWHRDNTIGLTLQPNAWCDDWVQFYRERRLNHQLSLAEQNGYEGELQTEGKRLSENLDRLFEGHKPEASLLHGDLWGGNWACVDDEPVIFDPSVYYGDREADIAMTRLFGGFSEYFYESYEEAWPLSAGHEVRCQLYQLYHVLNHLNLFGRSYLDRAVNMITSLYGA